MENILLNDHDSSSFDLVGIAVRSWYVISLSSGSVSINGFDQILQGST